MRERYNVRCSTTGKFLKKSDDIIVRELSDTEIKLIEEFKRKQNGNNNR